MISAEFSDYFESLIGAWHLERKISSGENLTGKAVFSQANENCLLAEESGQLQMTDGNLVSAHRRWIWQEEQGDLRIFFDESPLRLYHGFRPILKGQNWFGTGKHICQPDTYVGEYQMSADRMEIRQSISGPKKDYSIVSVYRRD